jgi:uncharacterized membrane protein
MLRRCHGRQERLQGRRRHHLRRQCQEDYDGMHWKNVPAGSCTSIKTPNGMGSLTPIKS